MPRPDELTPTHPVAGDARQADMLRESAEMFRRLAETDRQVFFLASPDFKTVHYVSPSYALVWGRSCESLYAQPHSWVEAIDPLDRGRIDSFLAHSGDVGGESQYRIIRGDGVRRWILVRLEQLKDAAGRVTRVCGLAFDITDLKRAQAEVAESELKYRRLFESAKDGILILEPRTATIVDINPFVLQLLGYSAADCRGKKLWDIGFFQDEAASRQLFKDLQATGYVRYHDLPLKTKAGRAVEVEFVSNLYVVDGVSVIQCNIRDISERKRGEDALRRLASIIQYSDVSIVGASLDGIIQSWNPASTRFFGFTAEEIVGSSVTRLCPSDLREEQSRMMEGVRAGTNVQQVETVRKGKDGKPRAVSFSLSRISDRDGKPEGFSAMYLDIEKSKQLESKLLQSQKMEGIGRLAGGIAHDFNNLLTGIMGYSQLVMDKLPAADASRDDVAEIMRSGNRAAALTHQLLAFSRQQVLVTTVVDANASVVELQKMLKRIIGEDIRLTFRPGAGLGHVKAACGQLEQIIMNLCINAKDAMAKGGTLLVETNNADLSAEFAASHPGTKAGRYVMLAVTDTGSGMSAEVKTHLFEPFFTTKTLGKGTGLGLSTVYGIVQQCGGAIDVYSEVGHGTTIKLYFPRVDEPLPPVRGSPPVHASYGGTETLLLVEDDESVRTFVARVLRSNGYTVITAKGPEEALVVCGERGREISLMLTDVVMPGMLGYDLSARLKPLFPAMKVVYMSGYTEQSIIQRAKMQDAPFIQKPMTPGEIARSIRAALDRPAVGVA
jgi:PAS domain S-box-containing protein